MVCQGKIITLWQLRPNVVKVRWNSGSVPLVFQLNIFSCYQPELLYIVYAYLCALFYDRFRPVFSGLEHASSLGPRR